MLLKADCSVVEIVMSVEIIFWKSYASSKYPLVKITQHKSDLSQNGWLIDLSSNVCKEHNVVFSQALPFATVNVQSHLWELQPLYNYRVFISGSFYYYETVFALLFIVIVKM